MRWFHALAAASALIAAPASADWQEASSPHFLVYADDTPANVKAYTEQLERFDEALRLIRAIPPQQTTEAERVRVFQVSNEGQIRRLYGGSGVAGFYESRVGGPVAFVPRSTEDHSETGLTAQEILLHEYTHHFMYLNIRNLVFPPWFVEGFAEFHATATFEKNGDIVFGRVPKYRAFTVQESSFLPARKLLLLDPGKLGDAATDALYSRGWLLIHMLTFETDRKGQLGAYINAINSGRPIDEATKVFGDLAHLDGDMTRYVGRNKLGIVTVSATRLAPPQVTIRALSAGEAAVMPARLRSTRGVDKTDAQDVVKLARQLATPFPNDAGAQNELAEAEYDAGNFAASGAAAARALAADPKSVHALVYRGMAAAAQLVVAKDGSADHWKEARGWFTRANHVDPDNPQPLLLYYQSFFSAGVTPTKNAEDGLLAAYDLAPFDDQLRVLASLVLLKRGDKAGARAALAQVAYGAHQGAIGTAALAAVNAIDAGNVPGAIAALDPASKNPDKKGAN